ncbi:glycoside hydrolase family 113 [Winogradskyella endarachnes]|uniref:Glycoside hydrolase n=1 Tax=Winogradskyella endarachnes TaxID=2681965 RepID=A0A6L6UD30_9FLAO|nr:glycoside hydrolase [Winogradskyella endarachnes]MUU78777.1 glycoside hydrolase [Winogradskyella endarachnes]
MHNFKCLFSLVLVVVLSACSGQEDKINGVSFVASRDVIDASHVNPIVEVNANFAAVMPFGFIKNLDHPDIKHNTDRQWFGETKPGAKQYIEELRKKDIKVMIKPQIWVWRGEFTGLIKMSSEENWKVLEASYSNFILEYVKLAKEVNAEIFCIGTELELFVKHRPQYWTDLITEIKTIYSGKLTYAANWDEFKHTPFWGQLDYIGIDAYFPVSDSKTPTLEECLEGWKAHKPIVSKLSETYSKPILFTEYGYRSVDFAGRKPWLSDRDMTAVNLEAQVNTTKALFETFWKEPWFAGGFIWKWFHKHNEVGGKNNSRFTPQNKPAEEVLRTYYKKEDE